MDLYTVFLCIFLLISPVIAINEQDEDLTEIVTASPDLNAGSTILPTNDSFNEFCKLSFEAGNGTDSVERFYYDFDKKACFNFTFKGADGNQNNFGSENDCLEQCYIEVGEAVLLKETDVIIIEPRSIDAAEIDSVKNKCSQPSSEKCSGTKVQSFYYSDEWQACFAYKACSKDQGYASRHECESSCKPMDGSVCGPQIEPISATKMGQDCSNTECPSGSICLQGMIPQCCNEESRKDVDNLYSDKCENEQNAAGASTEYFLPTVAKSCEELVCDIGHECKTVGKFAKCCLKKQKSKPDHRDSPIYEAFHQGLLIL